MQVRWRLFVGCLKRVSQGTPFILETIPRERLLAMSLGVAGLQTFIGGIVACLCPTPLHSAKAAL